MRIWDTEVFFTEEVQQDIMTLLCGSPDLAKFMSNRTLFQQDFGCCSTEDNNMAECHLRVFNDSLIVKRIVVSNTRSGVFTALVVKLLPVMRQHEVTKLVVESVLTEAMRDWCMKHQFVMNSHGVPSEDGLCVDYEQDLNTLESLLGSFGQSSHNSAKSEVSSLDLSS